MRFSFSRVECFKNCPYQFKLRYIDELKTLPDYDDPANALILGKALHHGIEHGTDEAVKMYYNSFPAISDLHINEAMKLKALIPKVQKLLDGGEFEVEINDKDRFVGYIDYLDRKNSILLDFKYTTEKNFKEKYLKSPQIHLYKWYLKHLTGFEVEKIGYLHIPKISIRQKKTETVQTFRNRLQEELEKAEPRIEFVEYDENLVEEFGNHIFDCETTVIEYEKIKKQMSDKLTIDFVKNPTRLCDWCEFNKFCLEGEDWMVISLPKNERRQIETANQKKMWIYGTPFSGKTTLADRFPDPIMLNTDGNHKFVTAPVVEIKDRVETEGRISKVTLAWEIFKGTVEELEKGSTFKTVVVDLLEDLYESCRLYTYDQMGITHESDDSFRAWDKVRTEFLSTMRKLTNLPYNIILISHEDTSKDITKRTGDRITSIRPNINEKVANKIAGMVDIVIRSVVVDGDYRLSFKADEVIFGGGRINPEKKEIGNSYELLIKEVYGKKTLKIEEIKPVTESVNIEIGEAEPVKEEIIPEGFHKVNVEEFQEKPVRRTRRTRN